VFTVAPDGCVPAGVRPVVTVAEEEGLTLVLSRQDADRTGLADDYVAGWITLRVHSALESVGLTAAVAEALARVGISCNVVAGFHHDHLFVPTLTQPGPGTPWNCSPTNARTRRQHPLVIHSREPHLRSCPC